MAISTGMRDSAHSILRMPRSESDVSLTLDGMVSVSKVGFLSFVRMEVLSALEALSFSDGYE